MTDHLKQWTAALRDPNLQQINGTLVRSLDDGRGFCCLGVGCKVAGVPLMTRSGDDFYNDLVYFAGQGDLPDGTFYHWLGFDEADDTPADLVIDWPNDLLDRQGVCYLDDDAGTCAGLNDGLKLTFPQIADLLDYFGPRNLRIM